MGLCMRRTCRAVPSLVHFSFRVFVWFHRKHFWCVAGIGGSFFVQCCGILEVDRKCASNSRNCKQLPLSVAGVSIGACMRRTCWGVPSLASLQLLYSSWICAILV